MKNENGADDLDQLDILDERWVAEVLDAITDNRISLTAQGSEAAGTRHQSGC